MRLLVVARRDRQGGVRRGDRPDGPRPPARHPRQLTSSPTGSAAGPPTSDPSAGRSSAPSTAASEALDAELAWLEAHWLVAATAVGTGRPP